MCKKQTSSVPSPLQVATHVNYILHYFIIFLFENLKSHFFHNKLSPSIEQFGRLFSYQLFDTSLKMCDYIVISQKISQKAQL